MREAYIPSTQAAREFALPQITKQTKEKRRSHLINLLLLLSMAMFVIAVALLSYIPIRDMRLSHMAAETVAAIKAQTGANVATVEHGGYEYIGCLSIPALDLELPMMSDLTDEKLKVSPCRYYGSVQTEDMVLAAHNYAPFFGHLKELAIGDSLIFTDVSGQTQNYTVSEMYVLPPSAVEEMIHSGYPLTLFTCTDDNENRLTVRCTAVEEMGVIGR